MTSEQRTQWTSLGVGTIIGIGLMVIYGLLFFEPRIREDQKSKTTAAIDALLAKALAEQKNNGDTRKAPWAGRHPIKGYNEAEVLAPGTQTMLGDDGKYHGSPIIEQ